jgi:hypothetical protein
MKNELITKPTIEGIVNDYNTIKTMLHTAYKELEQARKIGKKYYEYMKILPDSNCYRDLDLEKVLTGIRIDLWKYILRQTQADKFMTAKRKEDFDKMLESKDIPDITYESVSDFVASVKLSYAEIAEECVIEAFEFMKPTARSTAAYKTNEKSIYEVNRKVIFNGIMDTRYSYSYISQFYQTRLISIDNAFHLLDGVKPAEYPDDIISKINETRTVPAVVGNEYFDLKIFKNGNVHMTIKRTDILDKINRIAGRNYVKP